MRRLLVVVIAAIVSASGLAAASSNLEPQVVGTFTDVPTGAFYAEAVTWAQGADITRGATATTFSPEAPLDRKDAVVFLWRANGSPTGAAANTFTDVEANSYYEEAVNWAVANGVTTGVTPTTFAPAAPVSRAQFATLIWRAAGSATGAPASGFADVPAGSYFEEAVNWLLDNGVTTGTSATTFGPELALTRAMAVTFLWRDTGSPVFSLNIFHINDHHSHLEADDIDVPVGDSGDEVEVELGGFPRVVSAIDQLRAANGGENNVTVHAGDAITGTLFYTLFEGEADADLMNEVCFDVFAPGNHEFDAGDAGLVTFLDFIEASAGTCETDVVAANVRPAPGSPLSPGPASEDYLMPYSIQEFNGESVAFIGLDISQKTQVSSSPDDTTLFLDEVATAQTVIDALTADGYDKIGLVTHYTYANDLELASMVTGVDFIVGGDSHSPLGDLGGLIESGGEYPTVTTNAGGDTTCIVQAWEYSKVVGALEVDFDDEGKVVRCGGDAHLLIGGVTDFDADYDDEGTDPPSPVTQAAVDAALAEAGLTVFEADADAQAILDGFAAEVDVLAAEVIGTINEDLCLARFPYDGGRSDICDDADLPNGGEVQQLVTDAFLARALNADIALQNSGGVRIDLPAGDLSIADAYEVLPFANTLVELQMTGAEIVTALEQGLANPLDNGGSSGAYPYGSGIRWDVDTDEAFGSRFSNVEVRPKGDTIWVDIEPGTTYNVVANSFMVSGGDGFQVLADVADDGRATDLLLDYAQSFIDYVEQDLAGSVDAPTEFSTQTFLPVPPG